MDDYHFGYNTKHCPELVLLCDRKYYALRLPNLLSAHLHQTHTTFDINANSMLNMYAIGC